VVFVCEFIIIPANMALSSHVSRIMRRTPSSFRSAMASVSGRMAAASSCSASSALSERTTKLQSVTLSTKHVTAYQVTNKRCTAIATPAVQNRFLHLGRSPFRVPRKPVCVPRSSVSAVLSTVSLHAQPTPCIALAQLSAAGTLQSGRVPLSPLSQQLMMSTSSAAAAPATASSKQQGGGSDGGGHGSEKSNDSGSTFSQSKSVSWWLFACSAIVFSIVVVGGTTRLTRSGLSIVSVFYAPSFVFALAIVC
jgi:hypothetical protein